MRKKIPYNTKLPVKFTLAECDLIRNHTFYHPDFANLAMLQGKQIRVDMSLDDIETFEKCSILLKFKEGEDLSADASLRVTGGIY